MRRHPPPSSPVGKDTQQLDKNARGTPGFTGQDGRLGGAGKRHGEDRSLLEPFRPEILHQAPPLIGDLERTEDAELQNVVWRIPGRSFFA